MDSLRLFCVVVYLISIMVCCIAASFFMESILDKPIGLPCDTVSHDGHLVIFNDNYAYLVNGKESLLLAKAGPHSQGPFTSPRFGFFEGLTPNSSMHAEFCSNTPVRLIANGIEVYKRTQERAELTNVQGRKDSRNLAVASLIVILLSRIMLLQIDKKLTS